MRGITGERCPEHEFRPATKEGEAVIEALARPGVWQRAGMGGELGGLFLSEALASLPGDCDRERARALFVAAEQAFLVAHFKAKSNKTEQS